MEDNQEVTGASAVADQALVVPTEPFRLGPSGFDPSRWETSRFHRLLNDLKEDGGELSLRAFTAIDSLAEAVEDLCVQFAYQTSYKKSAAIHCGGTSALEDAFDIMGWHDPHRVPECTCDEPGCWKWATGGWPTPDGGYRRTCFAHSDFVRKRDSDTRPKDGDKGTLGSTRE